MNIEQLKAFVVTVNTGSISSAAEKMFKTQPAVSTAIKKLEEKLGFRLFDRSGYRLELTTEGQVYYQKAHYILAQMDELERLGEHFQFGEEARLKLAIEGSANVINVLSKIRPIQQAFPATELILHGVQFLQAIDLVAEDKADLAITPWQVTFASEGDFETKYVDKFEFVFCIHKELLANYGVTKPENISLDLLRKIPQITPIELALNIDPEKIIKRVSNSIIKTNDYLTYQYALAAQLGWGPITKAFWQQHMSDDFVQFTPSNVGIEIKADICLVKNRNKILGPMGQAIWNAF